LRQEPTRHETLRGRVCLLHAENEEEAADRSKDASDEAQFTPKEKEVFALVPSATLTPRSPGNCTSASTP
jgi:hypothetical protein